MAVNKFLLFLVCCELKLIWSQIAIPQSLKECYRNNATFDPLLPLNLRVLVDIIQKLEKHSTTDIRIMSSSILHRFKFDGIEYQKDVQATENVLPFSGTGMQRAKHRLIEELVPGNVDALPVHVLSQTERCILHQAISNTVIRSENEDKHKPCSQFIQTEKLTGKIVFTSIWNCPRQQGVILTPYGTVALGSIIGAVAASLQHQNVALNQLVGNLDTPSSEAHFSDMDYLEYNEEEIDFVLPKSLMTHKLSTWYQALINSPVKLDNVWLTTIAGELAEMVVNQGPVLGNNMTLGATGFWQNTMRPTIYYFTNSHENFEATRSELMGGIDGMIIASYLKTWIQDFYSLRLSQILEMYYSNEGVTFNTNVKACDRAQTFLYAVPKTILNEQTYAIAQMLAYRSSVAYISPEALQRMVNTAIEKFYAYAENHLFPALSCQQETDTPRVEALLVLDGAWSINYTIDFLAVLIQDLDVSMYGSKMGIIHGTSGEWLLNVTNSPSLLFQALNEFTNNSWPTQLNYTQVLKTVFTHLNETWEKNREHRRIGNIGQVVILLTPLGYMLEDEKQSAITLLQQIKNIHPDVHFIYYVSQYNANLFASYILSQEDHIIKNSNIDSIIQHALTIPRTLRPAKSSDLIISNSSTPQFEDYITPSKWITYRIHSHWKRNMKKTTITIHSFGYGTMRVCLWIGFAPTDRQYLQCTELSGYNEVALTDHYKCTKASPCPDIYLNIRNVTSLYKCAEIDCKTPDQIRFIIRTTPQNSHYDNSTNRNVILVSLNILLLLTLYVIV